MEPLYETLNEYVHSIESGERTARNRNEIVWDSTDGVDRRSIMEYFRFDDGALVERCTHIGYAVPDPKSGSRKKQCYNLLRLPENNIYEFAEGNISEIYLSSYR